MIDKKPEIKQINFMGVKLDPIIMPNVYNWAKNNPETLANSIENMMRNGNYTNPGSVMAVIESDLK